jgi:long-chain fatty acid transport protein
MGSALFDLRPGSDCQVSKIGGVMMNSKSPGVVAGLAWLLALAGAAQAGGLYLEEFATNSMGTAGAGSQAYASDAGTTIDNPAGMTRLEGHQIFAGFAPGVGTVQFDKTNSPVNDGGNGGDQGGFIPMLGSGYAHKLHDRVRLGIGVFSVAGAALDADNGWAGRNEVTDISLFTLGANPGVAIKLTDWPSIGGNWKIVYAKLDWKLRGPGGGKIEIEDADDVGYGGVASVLLEPMEGLRFGLVYESEVDIDLSGDINVPPGGGTTAEFDLELPLAQAVRFSAYWDATEKIALLFSLGWEDWSTLETTAVSVNGGANTVPLAFEDTWRIGGGLHYRLSPQWMLQTGYSYDSSALKNKNRTTALPIDEQHRVGFGAVHQYSESLKLGMNFEWVNLGKAKVRTPNVRGSYERNDLFFFGFTVNWRTDSWRETFGQGDS